MKRYIYPRLRLHISFLDLIQSLFSFLPQSGSEPRQILQHFRQGNKQILVTLSVRTAFDLLLRSLKLPTGTEVLMSAVNIRDMRGIVQRHGLIPVPVDIHLDTLAPDSQVLESLISPNSRIFVVTHLFGSIINLKDIADLCKKYQILLVEDCAQAFCGNKYCGHPEADVSLFSFGPIKSCTALGGAIACIQEQTLAEKMAAIEAEYPRRSEFWFFKRVLKYLALKVLSIPAVYVHLLSVIKLLSLDLDSTINSLTRGFAQGDLITKLRYRPPQGMINLLWRRLSHDNHHSFERREAKARLLISHLSPNIVYPGKRTNFHSFWVFPILVTNPKFVIEKLRENGFDATRGNTSLTHFNKGNSIEPFLARNLLRPKQLNEQILYLPVSEKLPDTEIIKLAQLLNAELNV